MRRAGCCGESAWLRRGGGRRLHGSRCVGETVLSTCGGRSRLHIARCCDEPASLRGRSGSRLLVARCVGETVSSRCSSRRRFHVSTRVEGAVVPWRASRFVSIRLPRARRNRVRISLCQHGSERPRWLFRLSRDLRDLGRGSYMLGIRCRGGDIGWSALRSVFECRVGSRRCAPGRSGKYRFFNENVFHGLWLRLLASCLGPHEDTLNGGCWLLHSGVPGRVDQSRLFSPAIGRRFPAAWLSGSGRRTAHEK